MTCYAKKVTTKLHRTDHTMTRIRRPEREPPFEVVGGPIKTLSPSQPRPPSVVSEADSKDDLLELLGRLAAGLNLAAHNQSNYQSSNVGGGGDAPADLQDGSLDRAHIQVDFSDPFKRLGKGGMGEVWLGSYVGMPVAIKVLPKADVDAKSEAQFLEEIRLQSKMTHPRIVQVIGACRAAEGWFLVQELCSNKSLHFTQDVLRNDALRPKLDWVTRKRMAIEAAQGIAALHARKVMHLDIKPLNFLVTEHLQVKIGDLGLSRMVHNTSSVRSDVVGYSLLYAAPEVLSSDDFSFPSDVYSFSIVLYELFTGKEPYERGQGGADALAARHTYEGCAARDPQHCTLKTQCSFEAHVGQNPFKPPYHSGGDGGAQRSLRLLYFVRDHQCGVSLPAVGRGCVLMVCV